MNTDQLMTFVRSRLFAGIVTGVGICLIAVVIFEAGVYVGFHESQYSARWAANYGQNFGGPNSSLGFDEHMPSGHGATGTIVDVASSTITIASGQKQEQRISIGPNTIIRRSEGTLPASALTIGMNVVVIGTPDARGTIDATFIRVNPPLPGGSQGSEATSSAQ